MARYTAKQLGGGERSDVSRAPYRFAVAAALHWLACAASVHALH
jgi:hypothetical protein